MSTTHLRDTIVTVNPTSSTNTSEVSSPKQWHRGVQTNYENKSDMFELWKWCQVFCKPCRWFDKIDYEYKICRFCFKFKTFKTLGTFFLLVSFLYVLLFAMLDRELLPGGTVFFCFVLFVLAYVAGYTLVYIGLPPMVGHLLVGIICGNLPPNWFPSFDPKKLKIIIVNLEKFVLAVAVLRTGLVIDISRIKNHICLIIKLGTFSTLSELIAVTISAYFLLSLPWLWCALLGSILPIISLATMNNIMDRNRIQGFGEDKQMSTVLIAASGVNVIFSVIFYVITLSYMHPDGFTTDLFKWKSKIDTSEWIVVLNVVEQILVGIVVGFISGLLVSFFPDKHNTEATMLRILTIGAAASGIFIICCNSYMVAGGLLAVMIMCVVATNMWKELGWHERKNPVQYFYGIAYYLTQPVALSIIGFSLNFHTIDNVKFGLSILVILIGLAMKEIVTYFSLFDKDYKTNRKEKFFICVAWLSKGTFQALLPYGIEFNEAFIYDSSHTNVENLKIIKQTVVLAILITTPIVNYVLIIMSPKFLNTINYLRGRDSHFERPEEEHHINKNTPFISETSVAKPNTPK